MLRKFYGHLKNTLSTVEFKFILIPVMFILLRMFSLINNAVLVYGGCNANDLPHDFVTAIGYLTVSVL